MSIFDALNDGPPYVTGALVLDGRLPDEDVAEIRRLYATGSYRQVDLADQFGVCQPEISRIVNNKRRKS
jgi:hypothetical protein